MDEETVGILYVLVAACGFGTVGVLGILAADAGLSIPTVLSFRFAIATIVLWSLLAVQGKLTLLSGRALLSAVALGAVGYGVMSGLYFLSLEFMTAGLVAIVLYTYPVFVVATTLALTPARVSGPLLVALSLALAGVALIVGADPAGADPRGVGLMIVAALAYAGYVMGSERVLRTVDPVVLTAYVLPAAGLAFLTIGLGTGSVAVPTGGVAWATVLTLGVFATVVPIVVLYAGLQRIGSSRTSIVSTAEPAAAVALGAAVLGEPIEASTVLGGALVVAGVVLIHRRG